MRKMTFAFIALAAILFGLPGTTLAQSQATTGIIEGSVTDENGGALPGIAITIRNTDTNFELTTTTDNRGRFRGVLLPLGPYEVIATQEGMATLRREGMQLGVGQTLSVGLEMKPATVSQEIVVTAETPLIETSRTDNSVTIDRATIEGLPNLGRNFLEFTKLTPGVATVQGPDGDELTINGQKGIQNNISVDGADFNNPFFGEQRGGQRPAFTFNIDAVQEFVVVPYGAPAEFGRSSSGFVNVVTKSGTNDTRGTVNLFYGDSGWASEAKRPDGTTEPKPDGDRTQVGFTLGGPIRSDKTFYFLAADLQDGTETKQQDPTRIEQRVVDFLAGLGMPNQNAPIERSDDNFAGLAKIDNHLSDSNLLTARFTFTDTEQANGTFDVDSWGTSANAIEKDSSWAVSLANQTVLGDNVFNEARFQLAREDRPRTYDGPINPATGRPFPDVAFDFGGQYRFGMPFFIPVTYHDTRWQLNDNITWLTSNHTIKAGVEYNQTTAFQTFRGFFNSRIIFSSTDGFMNYVNNPSYVECSDGSSNGTGLCPVGTTSVGPVLLYLQQAGVDPLDAEAAGTQNIRQEEPAVFVQDTWQPTGNVTIQYGLRWEGQKQPGLITPKNKLFYADFIGATSMGQEFPGDGTIPSDYNFQPRFGISWDVNGDGKRLIRANAGRYVARIPGLNLASSRSTDGSRGQTLYRDSILTFLGPVPAFGELIPQSSLGDPFLPDVFVFDKDFENPETDAIAISFEQQLWEDWVLLLKYNHAETDHQTRFLNLNDDLLGSPWSTGLAPGGANGILTLTTVESGARSEYDGYTLGLTKRYSDRYQFSGFYTYSEDMSDDDNERDPFSFRYAKITDLDAEWSYSDRDQPHRVNLWFLYNAPGDVNINVSYQYRSGQPKSLKADGTDALEPADRINPDGSVTRRNLGRKNNRFRSVDLRVSKAFKAGGGTLELIGEVFNVFNAENFKKPESTSLVFNFDGTIASGLGEPRQYQLGLRYGF